MTEKHKKSDDEIIFDFQKIKTLFNKIIGKTKGKAVNDELREKESEEKREKESGLKETLQFLKKYSAFFIVLIPIILTIFLRLQPMQLPLTDEWAESTVNNYYKTQLTAQIEQQYPNLPPQNKQALVNAEFEKVKSQNKEMIEQQIKAASQQFKEQMMYDSGSSKYVYLGDIDSYFWLRDARKVIEKGINCDEIDYEKQLCYVDTYTQAPLKSPVKLGGEVTSIYTQSIIYTYKILKLFDKDMTIMQASFYVPTIYAVLSVILAFMIGKILGGNLAGLVASVFITINQIFLSRTLGSDNDAQNLLYPLLVVLFFVYTIKTKDIKKKIALGILTGLSIGAYAKAWQGWWYIFNFIIATLVIYGAIYLIKEIMTHKKIKQAIKSEETKNIAVVFLSVFFSSVLFITLLTGFENFLNFIKSPFWFVFETKAASLVGTYWPNVLVTVAEFNPGSIGTTISQMGGKLLFFIGLMGIPFIIIRENKINKEHIYVLIFGAVTALFLTSNYGIALDPKIYMLIIMLPLLFAIGLALKTKDKINVADIQLAILLAIWFVATTYAALKGVRFTLLMVAAFGVALAIAMSGAYRIVSEWISRELKINEIVTKTVVIVLLLLLLIAPTKAAIYTAEHFVPSVNDAWYDSLTKIKDNSKPEAIINSWWDFGHWFKYIADRRVTLDGSSQSGPPLHWLGKLMLTDDEKQSAGILRMLDCGSNSAFDELNGILNDTPRTIEILDELVTLDKKEAAELLLKNLLSKTEASEVLKHTHCEPPENFFITSEDMVGKAGVWSHFGSWNFEKAEMHALVKGTDKETGKKLLRNPHYNLTEEQIETTYYEIQSQDGNYWVAQWPSYFSPVQGCNAPTPEGIVSCNPTIFGGQQIPLIINLTEMDVYVPAGEKPRPNSIVYVTEEGTEERVFENSQMQFSVILIPSGSNSYSILLSHPYLANSMFTRMFYLDGHGLKYFNKFDDRQGITGGRIITWKVDWEGTDANKVYTKEPEDIEGPEKEKEMEIAVDNESSNEKE